MKRWISILLTLLMVLSLVPGSMVPALAEDAEEVVGESIEAEVFLAEAVDAEGLVVGDDAPGSPEELPTPAEAQATVARGVSRLSLYSATAPEAASASTKAMASSSLRRSMQPASTRPVTTPFSVLKAISSSAPASPVINTTLPEEISAKAAPLESSTAVRSAVTRP